MKKIKDTFNAFMLEDATVEGKYQIPIVPNQVFKKPLQLVSIDKLSSTDKKEESIIDFYCDQSVYDSLDSIWDSIADKRKSWFKMFEGYMGLIEPNYEVSIDTPFSEGLNNTYRSRTLAYYLAKLGYYVIPNVRWGDASSYYYSFSGIEKHSTVAVYVPNQFDSEVKIQYFLDGFVEMIFSIEPEHVIIKGKIFPKLLKLLEELKVAYYNYE